MVYMRGKMREVEAKSARKAGEVGCVAECLCNKKPARSDPKGMPRENGMSSTPV